MRWTDSLRALCLMAIAACGGEGPSSPGGPVNGSIEVTTLTAGDDLDADG